MYLVEKKSEEGKFYAMKVIDKLRVLKKSRVQYLFSERNVLKALEHPFIVKLYEAFQSDTQYAGSFFMSVLHSNVNMADFCDLKHDIYTALEIQYWLLGFRHSLVIF